MHENKLRYDRRVLETKEGVKGNSNMFYSKLEPGGA